MADNVENGDPVATGLEDLDLTLQEGSGLSETQAAALIRKMKEAALPAFGVAGSSPSSSSATTSKTELDGSGADIEGRTSDEPTNRTSMGTGINVQDRVLALHRADATWRVDGIEQRHGRHARTGNAQANPELEVFVHELVRRVEAIEAGTPDLRPDGGTDNFLWVAGDAKRQGILTDAGRLTDAAAETVARVRPQAEHADSLNSEGQLAATDFFFDGDVPREGQFLDIPISPATSRRMTLSATPELDPRLKSHIVELEDQVGPCSVPFPRLVHEPLLRQKPSVAVDLAKSLAARLTDDSSSGLSSESQIADAAQFVADILRTSPGINDYVSNRRSVADSLVSSLDAAGLLAKVAEALPQLDALHQIGRSTPGTAPDF